MAKYFAKLGKVLLLGVLFLFLWFVLPNNVNATACCSDSECGSGYMCTDIPQDCGPLGGYGTCVSCVLDGYCMTSSAACCGGNNYADTSCGSSIPVRCGTSGAGPTPTGVTGCSTTAPFGIAVNWNYNADSVRFSWYQGEAGRRQALYVGPVEAEVIYNCPLTPSSCVIDEGFISLTTNNFIALKSLFTPGTRYYIKVVNVAGVCSANSRISSVYPIPTVTPTPTRTPTPTPTPTPWVRVNVKNPAGAAVNSSQICGVDCSGAVCVKKTGVYCSANDNSFIFPKFTATNTYLGGRIALTDNLLRPLVVVGVTSSVVGFVETTCNGLGGYCYVWNKNSWTTGGRTVDFVVASPTPTSTIAPTPTTAPGSWVKLKDSSFISTSSLYNTIPLVPVAYDSDDTPPNPYFILRDGGVVAAPVVDLQSLNPSAQANTSDIYVPYTKGDQMTTADFISYIKARKEYVEVKTLTDINNISASGIYLYTGPSPLTLSSIPPSFDLYNILLVSATTVDVNTNLDGVADPNLKSIAIVANMIRFGATVTLADGIFIANTIRTGTADFGLKINGNLIARTTFINSRTQTNPNVQSVFIVFKAKKYFDLLPYLSTASYEWRQIQ